MFARILLCFALVFVGACSSSPNRLDRPATPSRFVLAADAFTRWSVENVFQKSDFDGGLRRGEYTARYEDASGTFYEGPEKCMVLSQTYAPSQWDGGIWIPKDGNMKKARLWRYVVGMKDRYQHGLVVGVMDKMEEGNLQKIPMEVPHEILKQISIINP